MSRTWMIGAVFLIALTGLESVADTAFFGTPVKCCEDGFVLSGDLTKCVNVNEEDLDSIELQRITKETDLFFNDTTERLATCFQGVNGRSTVNNMTNSTTSTSCVDFQKNGTLVHLNCSDVINNTKTQCASIFTTLYMYGASMIIFANSIYIIPYVTVCIAYACVPGVRHRAYDLAVFNYAATQTVLSLVIIFLGYTMLCHVAMNKIYYILMGLMIEALTISGVLWLLILGFEVADTITKFRWAPSWGTKNPDEMHKFLVYLMWVFIGTFIPIMISTTLELSPLPDGHIAKPSFHNISRLNVNVILHVATVPVLAAIASSVLFIYTTIKVIKIQKSTSLANENRKKSVKEKYIFYLKLYLLMDAPYITGALGSIFEDLWFLKFCRMLQPMLMLYAVVPRDVLTKHLTCVRKKNSVDNESKQKRKTIKNPIQPC